MTTGSHETQPGIDDIDERYAEVIQAGNLAGLQTLAAELGDLTEVGHHLVSHAVLAKELDILRWLLSQGVVGKFSANQLCRLSEVPAELIHILCPAPWAVVWPFLGLLKASLCIPESAPSPWLLPR